MLKLLIVLLFVVFNLSNLSIAQATGSNFVTIVNPIRGQDFWEGNEQPLKAVLGEKNILQKYQVNATWLLRYDALKEKDIVEALKSSDNNEIGLFLEITPSWTTEALVKYRQSKVWHNAGSVFLAGYSLDERKKLIDQAFLRFKDIFGFYPKSVGAWWIDSYSLKYMQEKYQVSSALIVADQYSTDNYQVWGQYFATPYYPADNNSLRPAQNLLHKTSVVVMQWAVRDPVNGYGKGVEESTYSVQANDYIDYHDLKTDYFTKLIDTYTKQKFNQFSQVVVGLENSYSWEKYKLEYEAEIKVLADKKQKQEIELATMEKFSAWYQKKFPDLSPEQLIIADDPLGSQQKAIWFMNNYYRAGWLYNSEGSVFRDVRQYLEGQNELCYDSPCQEINFAKFSTRVLDEVTFGKKLIVDQGRIIDIKVEKNKDEYILSYKNEAGRQRLIRFLPRDIAIDNKISSIDGFILDASNAKLLPLLEFPIFKDKIENFQQTWFEISFKIIKFILFLILGIFIPGFAVTKFLKQKNINLNIFLAIISGMVFYTLINFFAGLLKINWLIYFYLAVSLTLFLKGILFNKLYKLDFQITFPKISKIEALVILLIIGGSIFQSLSMARSGWVYDFGLGFFGPTGHDGIWHQALINQLAEQIPPKNPGLSGAVLSNYHYFYDLLVAATFNLTKIPVIDLLYRFYPVLFSLLLGLGTYVLTKKLFNNKLTAIFSIYFVYFAGSFGWIVEYLKNNKWGGESDFWVNQPISMNLNPPFAISLIILIAVVLLLQIYREKKNFIGGLLLVIIIGSLVEFKVYAAIIVLAALSVSTVFQLIINKEKSLIFILGGAIFFALGLFYPQNTRSADLLVFSPFWFIHSMIDFPDRVGWARLSTAREAYLQRGTWFKYILTEVLGFGLFVIGNLGIRFIAFLAIIPVLRNKLILFGKLEISFIFWLMFFSLAIPSLVIQKGNPWNTIQFFYYFLYFAAILAGVAVVWLSRKLPLLVFIPLLILILSFTPINSWVTFKEGFSANSPARLTLGELEALNFLKQLPAGVVLTYPYDKNLKDRFIAPYPLLIYETTAYVSAFSKKPVFLEDEVQQEILQTEYKKRRIESLDFFKGRDALWSQEFFRKNKIRYIYLPLILNTHLSFEGLEVKQIFNNNEVKVFEVDT